MVGQQIKPSVGGLSYESRNLYDEKPEVYQEPFAASGP